MNDTKIDVEGLRAKAEAATGGPWRWREYGDSMSIIGKPTWPCSRDGIEQEWEILTVDDLVGEHPDEMRANARYIVAAQPQTMIALLDRIAELEGGLTKIRDLGSDGEHSGDRHARCRDIARTTLSGAQS